MSIPAKNIVQIPSVNTQQTYGGMGISSPSTSPLSIVTWRQAKILRFCYETIFQTPNTKAFWFGSLQLSWNKSGTGSLPLQVLKIHGLFTSVHNAVVLQTSTCTKKSYFKLQRSHMREGPWKSNTLFPCAMCLWASEQSRVSMCVLHHKSDTVHVLFSRWTISKSHWE